MLKYLVGIFAFVLTYIATKYIVRSVKATGTNKEFRKIIANKVRPFLGAFLAVLLLVVLAVTNFSTLRAFLYSVLSNETISTIVSMLQIIFGTHSVMYSLQLLGVYAILGSAITCAMFVVTSHVLVFLFLYFFISGVYKRETQPTINNKTTTAYSFTYLTLGQLRI